jgi:UDP-2-acetamido-3-amino-2,3-dideoxy-glucuronate N-acetyltransferase
MNEIGKLIPLQCYKSIDGSLIPMEVEKEVPFEIRRVFLIKDVPYDSYRADHASKVAYYVYVVCCGSVRLVISNGKKREEIVLDNSNKALIIPPLTWIRVDSFLNDAVLLVLSDHEYNPTDYISDRDEWLKMIQ